MSRENRAERLVPCLECTNPDSYEAKLREIECNMHEPVDFPDKWMPVPLEHNETVTPAA